MKKRIILPIIAVIAAVILFGGCFYTTQPNEYTIVRQFGAVVKVVDEPGLSMKLPFIQSVGTLPKTEMLYDLAASDVITSDKKSMVADSFVLWRIVDPLKFIQTLSGSVSGAEARLDQAVYNSLKTVISYNKAQFMRLSPVTRANLELTETLRGREKRGHCSGCWIRPVPPWASVCCAAGSNSRLFPAHSSTTA